MNWNKVPIKTVCKGIYDGPHATPPESSSGAVFLGIPNFINGQLDLSNIRYISEQDLPNWTKRVTPQPNDIVFSYEATLNLYAIIPKGFWGCLGRRMALIRVDERKADYKFLYYYFYSPAWRSVIQEHTVTGATVDRIPLVSFPDFEIELPDLPTQHRIASILSAYDDLIENNRRQIKLLEEAAQRLYREWFVELRFPGHESVKVVDGVPEGWKKGIFDDICIVKKDALTPDKISPGIPYIGLEHIPRNDFCLADWGMSEEVNSNKFRFSAGDILFGKIRPYFHKVGFTICNGICSTDSIVMNANDEYYCLLLMTASSDEFVDYTYQTCKEGAKMPRADWNTMKMYPVLIPDSVLLRRFNKQISAIKDKCTVLALQNRQLTEVRDRLLPKLINGEMEV